jgi:hypothetical protein
VAATPTSALQAKSRIGASPAFAGKSPKYTLSAAISGRMAMGEKPLPARNAT